MKFPVKFVSSFKKPLPRKKTEDIKIRSTTADHLGKPKKNIGAEEQRPHCPWVCVVRDLGGSSGVLI